MRTMTGASITVEQLLSHGPWAERLARRLVQTGDDPEDRVQEGWAAALRARPQRRDGLRPWLGEVLRNAAANQRRTDGRRRARDTVAGGAAADAVVPSPEELVGRMEVQRLLAELVLALNPPVRDV